MYRLNQKDKLVFICPDLFYRDFHIFNKAIFDITKQNKFIVIGNVFIGFQTRNVVLFRTGTLYFVCYYKNKYFLHLNTENLVYVYHFFKFPSSNTSIYVSLLQF